MKEGCQVIGRYTMYSCDSNKLRPFERGLFVHNPGEDLYPSDMFPQKKLNEVPNDFFKAIKHVEVELYSGHVRRFLSFDTHCVIEYSPLENIAKLSNAIAIDKAKHNST